MLLTKCISEIVAERDGRRVMQNAERNMEVTTHVTTRLRSHEEQTSRTTTLELLHEAMWVIYGRKG